MTVPIRVELFEADGAQRYVRDVLGRFARLQPVMGGPVRRAVRHAIVEQFRTRGRFGGQPWVPLRPSTIAYKRKHSQWRQEPMRRTDKLYRSLVYRENAVEQITKDGYTLRTLVSYAKFNFEKRPVIPPKLPESMITDLRNIVRGYIIAGEIAE